MVEQGIVIKHDESGIDVRMAAGQSCNGCTACFLDKDRQHVLHLQQDVEVQTGERVEIEISPAFAIKSALLIFFLPAVMIIAGYYFFQLLDPVPGLVEPYRGVSGAFCGIILSYLVVHRYEKHLQRSSPQQKIRIIRVLK